MQSSKGRTFPPQVVLTENGGEEILALFPEDSRLLRSTSNQRQQGRRFWPPSIASDELVENGAADAECCHRVSERLARDGGFGGQGADHGLALERQGPLRLGDPVETAPL